MVIQCDKCQTKFRLDDSKITGAGVKVRCTKCQNVFIVRPPGYQEAPPPPPPQEETPKEAEAPPPPPPSTGAEAGFDAGYGAQPGAGGTVDFKFGDESQQPQGGYGEFDFSASPPSGGAESPGGVEAGFDAGQGFQDSFGAGGFEPPSRAEEPAAPAPPEGDFSFGGIPPEPSAPQRDFGFGSIPKEPEVKAAPPPPPKAKGKEEFEFKTSEESGSAEQKGVDDIMKEAFGGGMTHPAEAGDMGGKTAGGSTEALKESLRKEDTKIHAEEFVKEKKTVAAAKSAREGMGAIIAAIIIIIVAVAVYFTGAVQIVKNAVSPPPPAVKAVDVESVSGYFVENKDFGKVFVIEAVIRNTTAAPQNVAGVVGVVYDSKGAKLASRPGAPGRIISKEDLKNLSKDDLVKAVKSAAEAGSGVIPGRASVPVMIVFTETPSGMSEYGIEIGR